MDTPATLHEPIFLGLGTNLGNREKNIEAALQAMRNTHDIDVCNVSTLLETPPWGGVPQPDFLNVVAVVFTTLSPNHLLQRIKHMEHALGRTPSERWGPRTIDIDILLFGDRIIESDHLIIPHPQLIHRDFVLTSLLELDPTLRHPASRIPFHQYLEAIKSAAADS